jgi:hypothetical protein
MATEVRKSHVVATDETTMPMLHPVSSAKTSSGRHNLSESTGYALLVDFHIEANNLPCLR